MQDNRIATEEQAAYVGSNYDPSQAHSSNKGCTRYMAELFGCRVTEDIADDRLVKVSQIEPAVTEVDHTFVVSIGLDHSVFQSSLRCKVQFMVNGNIVHETTYVDSDDSRDNLEWSYVGTNNDVVYYPYYWSSGFKSTI